MTSRSNMISRIDARYRMLDIRDKERARVLSFGIFFCAATVFALTIGIESARHLGPIAGSIAGVEIGGALAGIMRDAIDRFSR